MTGAGDCSYTGYSFKFSSDDAPCAHGRRCSYHPACTYLLQKIATLGVEFAENGLVVAGPSLKLAQLFLLLEYGLLVLS